MPLERPLLCLVTDRRRLIGDEGGFDRARVRLAQLAREAVDAGVDLIQVRERDLETTALVDLVATIVDVARGSSTRVVVNDRLDVAMVCGAAGVHLRSDSIAPAAARSIAPSAFLVGRSVHGVENAVSDSPVADYLVAGTIFSTPSKPSVDRFLGAEGLTAIVRAVRAPVLAIGGITLERLPQIAASGASGVAGITLFLPSARTLAQIVEDVRAEFDRVRATS